MKNEMDPKEKPEKETVTNDPDEAMNTPKDVEESKDPKIDQDFPGYPHSPAKEDVINSGNDLQKTE